MSKTTCPVCALYQQARGPRIRDEIAKTSNRRRDRETRFATFMAGVHARHVCGVSGEAALQMTSEGLVWLQADDTIHVSRELTEEPNSMETLAQLYELGNWCPARNAFHAHRRETAS